MTRRSRILAASVFVLAIGGAARGVGTIDTTGATIEAGAAPTVGVVTIDPAAPTGVVPTLPAIAGPGAAPTLTGSMPPLPSFGDGSGGAFAASGAAALPPGTHQFTSFTVTGGGVVTLSGATTILVQGDVSIAGSVTSAALGASITIRCGGNFTLVSRNPASLVQTTAADSPIGIVAGGKVAVGTDVSSLDARVEALNSSVSIDAHGTGISALSVISGRVLAPAGSIEMRMNGEFRMGGNLASQLGIVACFGPLSIQSFGDSFAWSPHGDVEVTSESATFECVTQFLLGGNLDVGGFGSITLKTVNGPFAAYKHVRTADGGITARCGGGEFDIHGATIESLGTGAVDIAVLGDVTVSGGDGVASALGDVRIAASGDVIFIGGRVENGGAVTITTSGGDIRLRDVARVEAGFTTIRASGDVVFGEVSTEGKAPGGPKAATTGSAVVFNVGYADIAAGGTVRIDAQTARTNGFVGNFRVLAQGDITVARTIESSSDTSLRSIAGDIDVAGATVASEDDSSGGAVAIETWKAGGRIDASNATIRSGFASDESGDVDLLVHEPGGAPPVLVASFILPKKLLFKSVAGKPEKTKLVATGTYDTGPDGVNFSSAARVTVGSKAFDVPPGGFVQNKNPSAFTYTSDALRVIVVTNKKGSSRARFRLDASGAAIDGVVPSNGGARLSFEFGQAVAGAGTVTLAAGKYTLGKKRGALVEPSLFPVRAKATLKGPGKDALSLVLGLATNGVTPAAAPRLHVSFYGALELDVAAAAFSRVGDRFVAPGIAVDYLKETITVKAKKIDLGTGFIDGSQPVTIEVTLGGETRAVSVRMVRAGTKLFY